MGGAEDAHLWKSQDRVPYHLAQYAVPYRSTVHLAEFIRSTVKSGGGEALDVACGAGANIWHLSQHLPGYKWTGVDLAGDVIFPIAKRELATRGVEATLVAGDFYRLTEIFAGRGFDLVLSIQTLMVVPDYRPALDQLLAVTRGWLIVTSLFTDAKVDAIVQLTDYTKSPGCQGPFFYNVYNLGRFREYCESRSAREFVAEDFIIDVDLPPPAEGGTGTYTVKLEGGMRLQFSGPLHMPWKFIAIRMGDR
jgi:hypothetical protein